MDVWRRWLRDPSIKLLIAEEGGKPIGIMAVKLREEDSEAFLCAARVHPVYRRRGVATGLALACLEYAREAGAAYAKLCTEIKNRPAASLAEKLGFKLAASYREVKASPKKPRLEPRVQPIQPDEAERAVSVSRRFTGSPMLFSFYEWLPLTEERAREYCEEGFAASAEDGVLLYQPLTFYRRAQLVIDLLYATRSAAAHLGAHLRHEAYRLGCAGVAGLTPEGEALLGLAEARYRILKSGHLIYTMKL